MREPAEAAANGERRGRPLKRLPRLDILAGGELSQEVAAELVSACRRSDAERAGIHSIDVHRTHHAPAKRVVIRGSAAQRHGPAPAFQPTREHEARPRSKLPLAVDLEEELPALGLEFEAVVPDQANGSATARVVERQFIGRNEPEEPSEESGGERPLDMHLKPQAFLGRWSARCG